MQKRLSDLEYAAKRKVAKLERMLDELEAITSWAELLPGLSSHYPNGEGCGRPSIGMARMLRMYIAQQTLGLSDDGIKDALYDSRAALNLIVIDHGREGAPEATTVLNSQGAS